MAAKMTLFSRRMRKIGLAEGLAYLFVIVTVFQYFIAWAAYYERKFTMKELINNQLGKKSMKKLKKAQGDDEFKELLEKKEQEVIGPKPSFYDLLPFQMFRLTKYLIVSLPTMPFTVYKMVKDHREKLAAEERLKTEEEEEFKRWEAEKIERREKARLISLMHAEINLCIQHDLFTGNESG